MLSDFSSFRSMARRVIAATRASKQDGGAMIDAMTAMPMKETVDGRPETWRVSYLLDTILTRDPWMHRIDIARATGRDLVLTPDHDGRIVADGVAEWARRHGQPFVLELTGPAGGRFAAGDAADEPLALDAMDFCRTLSGRESGSGLLAQPVPF